MPVFRVCRKGRAHGGLGGTRKKNILDFADGFRKMAIIKLVVNQQQFSRSLAGTEFGGLVRMPNTETNIKGKSVFQAAFYGARRLDDSVRVRLQPLSGCGGGCDDDRCFDAAEGGR